MLLTTLRDLQWRSRRFLIAGLGASTVFALTLVMAGLVHSFEAEPRRVLAAVGADTWVMPDGVNGVFTTISVVQESAVAEVAKEPGVRRADPIVVLHHTVTLDEPKDINTAVPRFLTEMKAEMPSYLLVSENESDLIASVAKDWTGGMPFTILYTPKGDIAYFRQGKVKTDILRAEIDKLTSSQ